MLGLAAALVILPCDVSLASEQAKRGEAIASGRCSRCHAVGRDDPVPQRGVIAFRDLHTRFPIEMLVAAAKSGSISGHDEMPGFDLGADDVAALLAHIDRLKPDGPAYGTSKK